MGKKKSVHGAQRPSEANVIEKQHVLSYTGLSYPP